MTNTGPATNPGDITVTGQRRRPDGSFPSGGGGGGSGEGGGTTPDIRDEPDPGVQHPTPDPCADPATALEWNADAAAAGTAKEFARLGNLAGEDGINGRERAAYLFIRPDGTVGIGPISQGGLFSEGGEAVTPNLGDIDPATLIGLIHSHPQARHLPSGPSPRPGLEGGDVGFFHNFLVPLMQNSPANPRMYIVARNELGAGQAPYNQINVYGGSNIDAAVDTGMKGPEVNPEGAPCPG